MNTRNESTTDTIATLVQTGHIERASSQDVAAAIYANLPAYYAGWLREHGVLREVVSSFTRDST